MNDTPNQTSGAPNQWPSSGDSQTPFVSPPKPSKRRILPGLVALLVLTLAAFLLLLNRYALTDYVTAHVFYTPSAEVKQLSDELALTSRAQDIFYASHPVITDSASSFPCKSSEVNSVILGCHSSTAGLFNQGTIYLLNVQNQTLEGVVQVTAAHEMLHAAYARLTLFDKPRVDAMVLAEYQKIKDDPTIKEAMAYYKIAEPGQDVNELHSIIGTTVANLDPSLEAYYKQYFADRAMIVKYYQNYFQALHKNDEQIKTLEAKLKTESEALELDVTKYQTDLQQLNIDIESFNQRASSGGFVSRSSFETARAALMVRVDTLNTQASSLNARVKLYNEDVQTLNGLSAQTQELYSSLKGVEAPASV